MIRFMLSAALIIAPTAASATPSSAGFTAEDLAAAARGDAAAIAALAATRRVAAQTEILRAILVEDMASAPRRISPGELRIVTTAIGANSANRDVALSWLMRSGMTTAADGELSGIYSPLADAWLMLRWGQVGGEPRLIDAALVRGVTLRAEAQPDWRTSALPFAMAMVQTRLQAMDNFALLPGAMGTPRLFALLGAVRDSERAAVFDRTELMLGGITAFSRDHGDDLDAITTMIRKRPDTRLLGLPSKLRMALTPMAAIASPQGTSILLQSPVYPARMVVATLATPGAPPVIDLVDLAPVTVPARSAAR